MGGGTVVEVVEVEVEVDVEVEVVDVDVVVAAGDRGTAVVVDVPVLLSPTEGRMGSAATTIAATEAETSATTPIRQTDAGILFTSCYLYWT
jgi:hypothetical protein